MARKTDQELKQLAVDITEGRVFTDWHFKQFGYTLERGLTTVFLPIVLGTPLTKREMNRVGMIYEYLVKAIPKWGVNGMPVFVSLHYLTKTDTKRLRKFYVEYNKGRDAFLTPSSAKAG